MVYYIQRYPSMTAKPYERTVKNGDNKRTFIKQDGIEYARQEDIPFYKNRPVSCWNTAAA